MSEPAADRAVLELDDVQKTAPRSRNELGRDRECASTGSRSTGWPIAGCALARGNDRDPDFLGAADPPVPAPLSEARPASEDIQDWVDELSASLGVEPAAQVWWIDGKLSPMLWASSAAPRLIIPIELWKSLDHGSEERCWSTSWPTCGAAITACGSSSLS